MGPVWPLSLPPPYFLLSTWIGRGRARSSRSFSLPVYYWASLLTGHSPSCRGSSVTPFWTSLIIHYGGQNSWADLTGRRFPLRVFTGILFCGVRHLWLPQRHSSGQ